MSQYLSGVWKGQDESVDMGADIDDKFFADKIFDDESFDDQSFEADNPDDGNTGVGIGLLLLSSSS